MVRLHRLAGGIPLLVALVAVATASAPVNAPGTRAARLEVTIGSMASQLGVKVAAGADDEFRLGVQFTGTLVDAAKLEGFGIKGMHAGARVTVARIADDRVYVEADELDPPHRGSTRLRLDPDGRLAAPPRV